MYRGNFLNRSATKDCILLSNVRAKNSSIRIPPERLDFIVEHCWLVCFPVGWFAMLKRPDALVFPWRSVSLCSRGRRFYSFTRCSRWPSGCWSRAKNSAMGLRIDSIGSTCERRDQVHVQTAVFLQRFGNFFSSIGPINDIDSYTLRLTDGVSLLPPLSCVIRFDWIIFNC